MKKNILLIFFALLAITSCSTQKKVVYFQDMTEDGQTYSVAPISTLKLMNGDKVSIVVTSAATPDLALRYNLLLGSQVTSNTNNQENYRYTIDENGCVDLPGIGRTKIAGMTRSEAAAYIQQQYRNGVVNDAVVTVAAYDRFVMVLGDVARPGKVNISRDNFTIIEALSSVGDLNITGQRSRIKVIRNEGGENKTYFVDMRSKDVFNSPVYYLKQNDIVYVEPNKVKKGQSTNNDNSVRSISTWLSVTSVLTSIAILIFR